MKTAGKYLENEELEKVLKKTEGLGTEATSRRYYYDAERP